jgi:hypothetical protein
MDTIKMRFKYGRVDLRSTTILENQHHYIISYVTLESKVSLATRRINPLINIPFFLHAAHRQHQMAIGGKCGT